MTTKEQRIPSGQAQHQNAFESASARRLLIMGGTALIIAGMIFGDIFAVFILHPNADHIGQHLLAASQAITARDSAGILGNFRDIGNLLENRGTKVDAHIHIIDFGYLAFVLALLQPWIALTEKRKQNLAILFLSGAALLPAGVFLIHYVGQAYSPFSFIGWASIAADFGGLLVIMACAGELIGIGKYFRRHSMQTTQPDIMFTDRSWASRALFSGGTLLILAGFIFGAYYAGFDLYSQESQEVSILARVIDGAVTDAPTAALALNDYGLLQANKAVKIAAHAHFIEFGVLAFLLAFIQPYVFLNERWKRRWVIVLLFGSAVLPVFVPLELRWGLLAGGIADAGGALVVIALLAMLIGILRYTGQLDSQPELAP